MTALLDATISVGYNGRAVARDVPVRIDAGRVLAVLGPNGAGKTTLLLTLAGFLRPISGTICLDGEPVKLGSCGRMNRAGVVLVPDTRALFTQLTTMENLKLAAGRKMGRVEHVLELFPALANRGKVKAGNLSGGEQQMLAVGRALVQRPRVLLVDEMSMGLAPVVAESLVPVVRQVAEGTGAAVILVEQHAHIALHAADDAMIIVHGEVTHVGPAAQIRADALALEAAYLGN